MQQTLALQVSRRIDNPWQSFLCSAASTEPHQRWIVDWQRQPQQAGASAASHDLTNALCVPQGLLQALWGAAH
jgi:hypothetical protein